MRLEQQTTFVLNNIVFPKTSAQSISTYSMKGKNILLQKLKGSHQVCPCPYKSGAQIPWVDQLADIFEVSNALLLVVFCVAAFRQYRKKEPKLPK